MYINEQSMCKGFSFFRQCVLFVHFVIVKDLFKKYFLKSLISKLM